MCAQVAVLVACQSAQMTHQLLFNFTVVCMQVHGPTKAGASKHKGGGKAQPKPKAKPKAISLDTEQVKLPTSITPAAPASTAIKAPKAMQPPQADTAPTGSKPKQPPPADTAVKGPKPKQPPPSDTAPKAPKARQPLPPDTAPSALKAKPQAIFTLNDDGELLLGQCLCLCM